MIVRARSLVNRQRHMVTKQSRKGGVVRRVLDVNILPQPDPHAQETIVQAEEINAPPFETKTPPPEIFMRARPVITTESVGVFLQTSISVLILIMLIVSLRMMLSSSGQGRNSLSFIQDVPYEKDPAEVNVKFTDVAGLELAKLELQEIVDFLKNPERYTAMGAKIPKGCLLIGGPGLGKTLLAKAVAGEAEVPFFSASAAQLIELFVGVGAARVRDLFKRAKEKAPCIIFIDEIDAIGKTRSSASSLTGSDERDQTINQLLTEMDGFTPNLGVVVIAATNRPDILDSALTRPGRFDRQIALELPGLQAREAILNVHARDKPFSLDVKLQDIAKMTVGFSGAQLANLLNEAAIIATRKGQTSITNANIQDALDRITLGLEKPDIIMSDAKKRLIAFHEAGHALTALKVGAFDTLSKVTIIPRGSAGGVTVFTQDAEHIDISLYTRQYLENQLVVALGGRVAEEIIFGEENVTTGATMDLERVQMIARKMVTNFGFSGDKLGHLSWPTHSNKFDIIYSEQTAHLIDTEIKRLANEAYIRTKNILIQNLDALHKIANALLEKETLTAEDIDELLFNK
jgi:cell division protease FtsH